MLNEAVRLLNGNCTVHDRKSLQKVVRTIGAPKAALKSGRHLRSLKARTERLRRSVPP